MPSASAPFVSSMTANDPPPAICASLFATPAAPCWWSIPSCSQMMLGSLAPAAFNAASSAVAACMRSGANGCGTIAAAVLRASPGASIFAVTVFAAAAVPSTMTGRRALSASPIRRSIAAVRSGQRDAADQPLSTRTTTGPVPLRPAFLDGFNTGSANARMTSVAASKRISVSHHGVFSDVFSSFSMPTRMRVGGNSI